MDFRMEADLPPPPEEVWRVMVDIGRIAACIPGCEQVEERERLKLYYAVMKQKIGPFKLEVPAEIVVEDYQEPAYVRAYASGRDKFTGTTLKVGLLVTVEAVGGAASRLIVEATLTVAGRLASLGYGVIKKKAEENFAEFEKRFLAELEAI
jgi:hypothetical protein